MTAAREFLEIERWIEANAEDLDLESTLAADVLPRIAEGGFARAGVPRDLGGAGGDTTDGVRAISAVAERSLAASFVLWGHRAYIEFLLQSTNESLRESELAGLLSGKIAGATGLSNAMKSLAGLEPLQITATSHGNQLVVDGKMPWVTNLRVEGFKVAAAVDRRDGQPTFVASFSIDDRGLERSADLPLMGMRSSNTAAIKLSEVNLDSRRVIADNAAEWLPRVRPAFVGLQCGMSIGLARRCLREASEALGAGRGILAQPITFANQRLARAENLLFDGLKTREFENNVAGLFEIRIELASIVAEAVSLELQATGGKAYLTTVGSGFGRRWREAAFVPIITPSIVQLKAALQKVRSAA
jgi:alkylation response protein AidB-like acyl-CoA dehydrogenase